MAKQLKQKPSKFVQGFLAEFRALPPAEKRKVIAVFRRVPDSK